ncbi:hypothetical protein V491_05679 [Pseudogymnoascus sp. VKM F-3775]|nr:hypothetical protein V491_05679 [Pseudogymnoascus sp. VKM F-3775]
MSQPLVFILEGLSKGSNATLSSQNLQGFKTPFYTIQPSPSKKSNLAITRASPDASQVGIIQFHTLSSKMELVLQYETVSMRHDELTGSRHEFTSPTFRGDKMAWKEDSLFGHGVKLVSPDGQLLARFRRVDKATGTGSFEVFIPADGVLLDLILVSGIAASEYRRRSNIELTSVGDVLGQFL